MICSVVVDVAICNKNSHLCWWLCFSVLDVNDAERWRENILFCVDNFCTFCSGEDGESLISSRSLNIIRGGRKQKVIVSFS